MKTHISIEDALAEVGAAPLGSRVDMLVRATGGQSSGATREKPDPLVEALVCAHAQLTTVASNLEDREREIVRREADLDQREASLRGLAQLAPLLPRQPKKPGFFGILTK